MKTRSTHTHGWLVGALGLVIGITLMVGFPRLEAIADMALLLAILELVGFGVVLGSAYSLFLGRFNGLMTYLRLKKCLKDLGNDKLRTFVVVLAIAIGIVGAGTMINSYVILSREINVNYMATNPASFTLWTDDAKGVQGLIRDLPEVQDVELRRIVPARLVMRNDDGRTLLLYVIEDISNSRIDSFELEAGRLPVSADEIILERDALGVAGAKLGDTIFPKLPHNDVRPMKVTGVVHAPGLPPASMEKLAYGFVTKSSLEYLGKQDEFDEVLVVVAANKMDEDHIRTTAEKVIGLCRDKGHTISKWEIHKPGRHPHANQLNSFLFLLQTFGLLALVLSGLLVVNMITSMMAGQVKQIGIMKAIGANSLQITGLYTMVVFILGVFALVCALPLANHLGAIFADICAGLLNFDLTSYSIPPWAYLLQIAIGLLVPLLAASFPIVKASKVTVHQAMTDSGTAQTSFGSGLFDFLLGRIRGLTRPMVLSIRNAFRKKGRLILTLVTLSFGGSVFILALNVNVSMEHTVVMVMGDYGYDIRVDLDDSYEEDAIGAKFDEVKDVSGAEVWSTADVELIRPASHKNFFIELKGVPSDSEAFRYPLIAGRRLTAQDNGKVLIDHKLALELREVGVGDTIKFVMNGHAQTFEVAGIVKRIGAKPGAFLNDGVLKQALPPKQYTSEVYLALQHSSPEEQIKAFGRIEKFLSAEGYGVDSIFNVNLFRKVFIEHMKISIVLLLVMAGMIIVIGGIGLMSTMSINVMERTREIGVMRSIGASNRAIRQIFVGESIVIGLTSWVLSALLAVPMTYIVGRTFGMIFIKTPLDIIVAPSGFVIWFVLVVIVATLAALYPARKAYRHPVREALAYE